MPLIACLVGLLGAGPEANGTTETREAKVVAVSGTYWQATSTNFLVTSRHGAQDARRIAEFCERCRAKLQCYWCGSEAEGWTPRCQVVIHPNQHTYLSAVGAAGAQTFGSSWIEFGINKQPSRRQIDFRGDHPHGLSAVPHELTHVLLADLMGGRQPPRWADEGMAMLADTEEKRLLHYRDFQNGQTRRLTFRAVELLTLEGNPHPSRIPSFYGQSLSLTSFLAARGSPTTFVKFLRDSLDHGYDAALRERYDIANIAELELAWAAKPSGDIVSSPLGGQ